jgi:hypothetical protein
MKKLISLALMSGFLALPTIATAAGTVDEGPAYRNRGQCESAQKTWRNQVREEVAGAIPPNQVNSDFRDHTACVQHDDGLWYWTFVP